MKAPPPMLAATDLVGIAAIITAFGTATALVIGSLAAIRTNRRIETKVDVVDVKVGDVAVAVGDVHQEVTTANGKTMAVLADLAEGRRALKIPEAERTASEQEHVDMLDDSTKDHRPKDPAA